MLNFSQLKKDFTTCDVLCVGDVILDRYIIGKANRLSPEAPVPVLLATHEKHKVGGAGNVVDNLVSLGIPCSLVGVVGDDASGQEVAELLQQKENCKLYLKKVRNSTTTEKTRFMSGNKHLMRVDRESKTELTEQDYQEILQNSILPALDKAKVLIISDYGKGLLTPSFVQKLIQEAKKRSVPVAVDPKGYDYRIYKGATLITPNKDELSRALAGHPTNTLNECVEAAQKLLEQVDVEGILVTRGPNGMAYITRNGVEVEMPAIAREVYDVSGAGDTVISMIAVGLGLGWDLSDAMELATICAGIVVGKVGTEVVALEELAHELQEKAPTYINKILSWDQAKEQVSVWKKVGLKVGFTNGCFDLLHSGHLATLDFSASQCDKLVLALNSCDSIKRLKGPERPVQDQETRALVLAALSMVDAVVVFDQDTPLELIEHLIPDVLIKGQDYKVEDVVGAAIVQEAGGRVALAPILPGHSTTSTVKKLRA